MTGKQIITMHTLHNISRTKDNQAMKFGQLIAYNIKNVFLEIVYIKCGGEAISRWESDGQARPFYKKIKIEYNTASSVSNVTRLVFNCMSKSRSTKIYKTNLLTTCFHLL